MVTLRTDLWEAEAELVMGKETGKSTIEETEKLETSIRNTKSVMRSILNNAKKRTVEIDRLKALSTKKKNAFLKNAPTLNKLTVKERNAYLAFRKVIDNERR